MTIIQITATRGHLYGLSDFGEVYEWVTARNFIGENPRKAVDGGWSKMVNNLEE